MTELDASGDASTGTAPAADGDPTLIPRCMVCRTPLPADPFLCPRCETPHHTDCWEYAGGCAIYGCAAGRAAPPMRPQPVPWQPGERWEGARFGALLGYAVVGAFFLVVMDTPEAASFTMFSACAAALTGAFTGYTVRGSNETLKIFFWGTAGPGLGAWLLATACMVAMNTRELGAALLLLVGFLMGGMLTAPAALPLAYLVARFNDPASKTPRRQMSWTLAMLAFCGLVTIFLLGRLAESPAVWQFFGPLDSR